MTTTPLPPLPVTEHNHPEHAWRWTPTEIRWMDARDSQWQAYATAARADLEAENKRLREALEFVVARFGPIRDELVFSRRLAIDNARAALESKP